MTVLERRTNNLNADDDTTHATAKMAMFWVGLDMLSHTGPVGDLESEDPRPGRCRRAAKTLLNLVFTRVQLWIEDSYRSCIQRQQKV